MIIGAIHDINSQPSRRLPRRQEAGCTSPGLQDPGANVPLELAELDMCPVQMYSHIPGTADPHPGTLVCAMPCPCGTGGRRAAFVALRLWDWESGRQALPGVRARRPCPAWPHRLTSHQSPPGALAAPATAAHRAARIRWSLGGRRSSRQGCATRYGLMHVATSR